MPNHKCDYVTIGQFSNVIGGVFSSLLFCYQISCNLVLRNPGDRLMRHKQGPVVKQVFS